MYNQFSLGRTRLGSLVVAIAHLCFHSEVSGYLYPIATRVPLPGTPSPPGSLWPLPQLQTSTNQLIAIDSPDNFEFVINVEDCKPLVAAVENRYRLDLILHDAVVPESGLPVLSSVALNIPTSFAENQCNAHPKLSSDINYEKYNVTVSVASNGQASASISAYTVWGALRGLESFSQLLWRKRNESESMYYYVNVTEVSDWPRYPHRGLMIDSARHFLAPSVMLQILDGMAYNKLNVLHWHIIDDQSFPFVSTTFPELSEKGAYIPGELEYSPETVQNIIEEARVRGIRVILEFDTPGHTYAFGHAFPELLTPCYGDGVNPGTPNYGPPPGYIGHGPYEIMNPMKNFTYEFMKELFTEIVSDVIKDEYVHLGMDEVYYTCWNSSPEIAAFMREHGYVNISQVQKHYTDKLLDIVKELGAKRIVWQDPLDYEVELDKDVIVQVWKSDNNNMTHGWQHYFQKALDLEYKVILSSCWYLNYIEYGPTWTKYYECDPVLSLKEELSEEQLKLILGGEAAIWSEYVDNTNILPRFFPFANAVAERLWSPMNSSTTDDAMWRLDEQRCRMLWRGLPAQPIMNGYCSAREYLRKEPVVENSSTRMLPAFVSYSFIIVVIVSVLSIQ